MVKGERKWNESLNIVAVGQDALEEMHSPGHVTQQS